jgi:hypothetical protein
MTFQSANDKIIILRIMARLNSASPGVYVMYLNASTSTLASIASSSC